MRLHVFLGLLCGLRKHDFRAAATWINAMYPSVSPVAQFFKFVRWPLWQMTERHLRTLSFSSRPLPDFSGLIQAFNPSNRSRAEHSSAELALVWDTFVVPGTAIGFGLAIA